MDNVALGAKGGSMNDNIKLGKCPFCGSSASLGVDADCDGYQGTIGIFCDNPYCGGAYLGERRTLRGDSAGWVACFAAEEIKAVVGGWNNRGSAVVRGLIANAEGNA